jgi:hypothetical protein
MQLVRCDLCRIKAGAASKERNMTLDRAVLMFAGFMVLASLALGYFVSPWWFLLTAFAGLNMLQASVTGFCPAAMLFKRLGCKSGIAFK